MPVTIRQTLLGRIQGSRELADLSSDLEALAGLRLRLVDPLAKDLSAHTICAHPQTCKAVLSSQQNSESCQRFAQALATPSARDHTAPHTCYVGLTSIRSPIRLSGETIGFLVVGPYLPGESTTTSHERSVQSHILDQTKKVRTEHLSSSPVPDQVTEAKHKALQRWLQLAAESLVHRLEAKENVPEKPLPAYITRICAVIQRNYQEPPSLTKAAEICGLSKGYFCRAFHEFTGLRFVEYIQAVRIEHVCEHLKDPAQSISEAAFANGFQSLSQFNRAFRKLKGTAPRNWRKTWALTT